MPPEQSQDNPGRRHRRVSFGVAVLCLMSRSPLQATFFSSDERGGRGPAILKRETGVRAAGLGGAFVGVANDVSAIDWNPAGLQQLPQSEFLFMHEDGYADQFHEFGAFARPFWKAGKRRTWGARVSYLSMDSVNMVEDGTDVGQTTPWESLLGLSYAETLGETAIGFSAKTVQQSVAGQSGQAFALDAGLLGKAAGGHLTWGTSLSNVGTSLTLGSETIDLPVIIRGGASYDFPLSSKKDALLLALEIDAPIDDKPRTGLGLEYTIPFSRKWRAAFRGGYRTDRPSEEGARLVLGAGLETGSFRFNYAFSTDQNMGDLNRFDLAVRFGKPLAEEVRLSDLLTQTRSDLATGQWAHGLETIDEINRLSPVNHEARTLSTRLQIGFAESLDPDMLSEQGDKAFREKHYEKSAACYRKLLLVQPDRRGAQEALTRAESAIAKKQLEQAKTEVARGRRREVLNQIVWAQEEERQSHWAGAATCWRKALALDGKNKDAMAGLERTRSTLYQLAEKAEREGDLDKARLYFRAAQEGGTPYRDSEKRLSSIDQKITSKRIAESQEKYTEGSRAFAAGEWTRAEALFKEALQATPDNPTVRRALERVREELDRQKKSR